MKGAASHTEKSTGARWWRFRGEWFLLLLPLFFAVHQWAEHFRLVDGDDVLKLLAQTQLTGVLFLGTGLLLLRRFRTAALLALLLLFLYLFFGALQDGLKSIWRFPARYIIFLPLLLTIVVATTIYLKRIQPLAKRMVRWANVSLLVLTLLDASRLLYQLAILPHPSASSPSNSSAPSVFLVVADEYAGGEGLRAMGFDNSAFMRALEARGFSVARHASSNYNYTPYSISSLLNMQYLAGLEGRNSSPADRSLLYPIISNSRVGRFFDSLGYDFVNLSPFRFAGKAAGAHSGRFFLSGPALLRAPTLPARLDRDLRFALVTRLGWTAELRRLGNYLWTENERVLKGTVEAASLQTGRPRFVYAHLMMPHYPYLFDSAGRRRPEEAVLEGAQTDIAAYRSYLHFSNRKFLQMIDGILQASKVPPIILFVGDHGFRHGGPSLPEALQFSSFAAVRLPGLTKAQLPDSITLVNQFRWLLNAQFGQRLGMLQDSMVLIRD